MLKYAIGICALTCFLVVIGSAQTSPVSDVVLTVGGEVPTPLSLKQADLSKLPRQKLRAKDHDGKEYEYEGVAVKEILQRAGLKFGEALRGKALATYLLVEATDHYQAVYALPEMEPTTPDRLILLADRQNGAPLPASSGPLKIIVPGDAEHARWVRQIKSMAIVRAPAPTGK